MKCHIILVTFWTFLAAVGYLFACYSGETGDIAISPGQEPKHGEYPDHKPDGTVYDTDNPTFRGFTERPVRRFGRQPANLENKMDGLTIRDDDGKIVAQISPTHGGGGFWIEGSKQRTIAVYIEREQMAIGFYDAESKRNAAAGMPLALSLGVDGVPSIQIRRSNGELGQIDLQKLYDLLNP